jgi:hypothetical protein
VDQRQKLAGGAVHWTIVPDASNSVLLGLLDLIIVMKRGKVCRLCTLLAHLLRFLLKNITTGHPAIELHT